MTPRTVRKPRQSKQGLHEAEARGTDEVPLPVSKATDDARASKHSRFVHWSRAVPTSLELKVWRLLGADDNPWGFVPQQELEGFVVDFFAPEFRLVLEADGPEHIWSWEKDEKRDAILASKGYKTLRLTPGDLVMNTPQMIFDLIEEFCDVRHDLTPED